MATTVALTFTIYLTDINVVKAKQAAFPNGWLHGPIPAATELSAELGYTVAYQERDDPFTAPCVRTAWHPRASSGKFKYDRSVFTISGGGFFGWLGFGDTRFIWLGQFEYSPADTGGTPEGSGTVGAGPSEWAAFSNRKWADGFEAVSATDTKGELGSGKGLLTRDASRTPDGYGAAIRSGATGATHTHTDSGLAAGTEHWERIYWRLRRAPVANVPVLTITLTGGSGAEKLKIYITPGGQIALYTVDNASVETLQGTIGTLTLGVWTKVDLFCHSYIAFAPGTTSNALWVGVESYLNGVLISSIAGVVRTSVSIAYTWFTSNWAPTSSSDALELDVDDWIGTECPERFKRGVLDWDAALAGGAAIVLNQFMSRVVAGTKRFYRCVLAHTIASDKAPPNATYWIQSLGPRDFYSGAHVKAIRPLSFGAAHNAGAWTGDVRLLLRQPMDGVDPGSTGEIQGSTSGAIIEVNTDATKYGQGVVAMSLAVHGGGQNAPPYNTIGAGIAGAAPSMVTLTQTGARTWKSVINQPGGVTEGRTVHPLTLRMQKAATATANTIQSMLVLAEYIGVFDACDIALDPTAADQVKPDMPRRNLGIHNAPYPNSPWASLSSTPPLAGVHVKAGTYAGNDTGQDLVVATPPHFIWIRPLTGANTGQRWWSTMLGAGHVALEGSYQLNGGITITQEDIAYTSPGGAADPEERYLVRLSGPSPHLNSSGVTYQYVILSDPGSRFLLNGALRHGNHGLDDGAVTTLVDSTFIVNFLLAWIEIHTTPRETATARFYGKGPGHAANEASRLDAAATATVFNYATTGQLKAYSAINNLGEQIAYALFRVAEPGDQTPTELVFQTKAYIGNGAAGTRDIILSPIGGSRRPLFAIVIPDNAAAVYRDPSFSGGNSRAINATSDITTGITAGAPDIITVGTTLNVNLIDYSVLVLVGGTAAGNDGWSQNGDFPLKTPAGAGSPIYDPAPDVDAIPDDELDPTATDDTATTAKNVAVAISVLANDLNAGVGLTIGGVSIPLHGTAQISGTTIIYTPATDYVGDDSFTYTVVNSLGATATATVAVTVSEGGDGGDGGGSAGCRDNWGLGTSADLPYVPLT